MNPSTILVSVFFALVAARPFKFPGADGLEPIDTVDML